MMLSRLSGRSRSKRGFTLIEMMVTMVIIGLGMTMIMNYDAMLPQARLVRSVSTISTDLRAMRNHALFTQREVVFAYHLSENTYEAWYPFEVDEEGKVLGPGVTVLLERKPVEEGTEIQSVRLADGSLREADDVEFHISGLGRIAPHRVLVVNPDFIETERRWLLVEGMVNDARILEEMPDEWEVLTDASFR